MALTSIAKLTSARTSKLDCPSKSHQVFPVEKSYVIRRKVSVLKGNRSKKGKTPKTLMYGFDAYPVGKLKKLKAETS
jgi:hypothetical protein